MQLKVPSGEVWQVELNKCDGEIWLQNGWKEFAHYYHISYGQFLVFEYKNKRCFHVLIFDKSASEIDYPFGKINMDEEPNLNEEFQGPGEETGYNVSIEILDEFPPCRKTKEKSPLPCSRPHKMMRTNLTGKYQSKSKMHTSVPPTGTECIGMKKENSARKVTPGFPSMIFDVERGDRSMCDQQKRLDRVAGRTQPLTTKEKANAFCKAGAVFKSKNPFFMVAMQPSHVLFRYTMRIPTSFSREYFKNKHGNVNLCALNGRTWNFKYCISTWNGQTYAQFSHGWREFAQENNLEVGDVCVFELINCTDISLKIVTLKVLDANCQVPAEDHRGADPVKPKRSLLTDIESEYSSHDGNGMSTPLYHCATKEKEQKNEDNENGQLGNREQSIQKESAGREFTQWSLGEFEDAMKFTSMHPFFKVVIQPSHSLRGAMIVPKNFATRYLNQSTENVMLQVANRMWPVKLLNYPLFGQVHLSAGWREFARDNYLGVRDVCMFELIKSDPMLLKVSIFRHVD